MGLLCPCLLPWFYYNWKYSRSQYKNWILSSKKGSLFNMSKSILENLAKVNIGRQELINNGFSAQKYDDVQRGKSSYKLSDIISMSEKFQLSLDFLVYGKEKSPSAELTEDERDLLFIFKTVSEREKGELLGYARRMIETSSPEKRKGVS